MNAKVEGPSRTDNQICIIGTEIGRQRNCGDGLSRYSAEFFGRHGRGGGGTGEVPSGAVQWVVSYLRSIAVH